MTMQEAMFDGLSLMVDVLGARRKVDEKLVRSFLYVIQGDEIEPEDVEAACRYFTRDGEGSFPPGPAFRRRCQVERGRRETARKNAIYESRMLAMQDEFSDEHEEEFVSPEEARKIIADAIAKMERKWKSDNPLTRKGKSRRDLDAEVRAMRA